MLYLFILLIYIFEKFNKKKNKFISFLFNSFFFLCVKRKKKRGVKNNMKESG